VSDAPTERTELSEETKSALVNYLRATNKWRARQERRGFAAFLVLIAYGALVSQIDTRGWDHATAGFWFETIFLGVLAYVVIAGILRDDS
jgi:hypothetical protein